MANKDLMNEILISLKCASASAKGDHFCESPVLLSCGHYTCFECVKSDMDGRPMKCTVCGGTNKRNLNDTLNPRIFNLLLDQNITEAFRAMYDQFKNAHIKFKEQKDDLHQTIDKQIQFTKKAIESKIDNIVYELIGFKRLFFNELEEKRGNWEKQVDVQNSEIEVNQLKCMIDKQQNLTKENLFNYQNKIKNIQNAIEDLSKFDFKLEFKETETKITKDTIIGQLLFDKSYKINQKVVDNSSSGIEIKHENKSVTFSGSTKDEKFSSDERSRDIETSDSDSEFSDTDLNNNNIKNEKSKDDVRLKTDFNNNRVTTIKCNNNNKFLSDAELDLRLTCNFNYCFEASKYVCGFCRNSYDSKWGLSIHLNRSHDDGKHLLPCKICKIFPKFKGLQGYLLHEKSEPHQTNLLKLYLPV